VFLVLSVAGSVFDATSTILSVKLGVVTVVHHAGSAVSASIIFVPQPEHPLPFQLHSHNHSLDHFSWLRQCADIDSKMNHVVTT